MIGRYGVFVPYRGTKFLSKMKLPLEERYLFSSPTGELSFYQTEYYAMLRALEFSSPTGELSFYQVHKMLYAKTTTVFVPYRGTKFLSCNLKVL